jgi:hypothetical protein
MVLQQLPGAATIAGDDESNRSQDFQRPPGEIAGITRWRTDHVQRSHWKGARIPRRLLGWYGRSRADLFDLGDQAAAIFGVGGVLQTVAEVPHLAAPLLASAKIAFRLSTHIPSFLLMIETAPGASVCCPGGLVCGL